MSRKNICVGILSASLILISLAPGRASTMTTLYAFQGNGDGGTPYGTLVAVKSTLYGTTYFGGAGEYGTVFKIDPSTGKEKVVFSFDGASHGAYPDAGLVYTGGYLYGTTSLYGAAFSGTVFKIKATNGTENTIYDFPGHTVGGLPYAGLTGSGTMLYGAGAVGGKSYGGTVFSIAAKTGKAALLYSFTNGKDGGVPESAPIIVNDGLYGKATSGGKNYGTIFTIDASTGKESILYRFTGGKDGANPYAGLIEVNGVLYGTTTAGAAGYGTVFSINPATGAETTLYTFTDGNDGGVPYGGLLSYNNSLYGTTYIGGAGFVGTVFKLVP